jgi:glycosyltransferase involved in cell wall biosynthesis
MLAADLRATDAEEVPRKPLRILMVLESNFTPKGGGGAESQVRTLARHMIDIGQRVSVLTPLEARGPQRTAERVQGIPVARLPYPHMRIVGAGILYMRLAAFLLQNRDRYDVWHVHIAHHLGAVTCLLGDMLGKPVIVKISGSWELEHGLLAPNAGVVGRIGRSWLKRASAFQAISTRIAGELESRGFAKDRIKVLPNGIDLDRFREVKARRAPGEPFTVLYVGRLSEEKGILTLVDAWAQAFAGREPGAVRLWLVGGGALEATIRERVQALGIAEQVELLGHRDRVEDVIAAAHIGVLPSRIEGLSNSLLEFMASGLPTAASKVSGSEDFVVTGDNGWLFPVSDAGALAEHLRAAEALPSEALAAMGQKARADVEARAALGEVVGRLLALYRGEGT